VASGGTSERRSPSLLELGAAVARDHQVVGDGLSEKTIAECQCHLRNEPRQNQLLLGVEPHATARAEHARPERRNQQEWTGPPRAREVELPASFQFTGCKGPTGAISGSDGQGPSLQLHTDDSYPPPCGVPWPATNPALQLHVFFRNFLPSIGPASGVLDVSETDKILVELEASSQAEVPVGQSQGDFRVYRSDVPGSLGTVTSTRIDTPRSSSSDYLFRIDLANVKLGASTAGGGVVSFPDQASLPRATLYFEKLM